MNDQTLTEDPFAPIPLDEETELRALARALELSEGFKLIFVRCNQISQRNRLIDEVKGRLPKLNVQTIRLDEPTDHLLDTLRARMMEPRTDAIFVSGLEYSLPDADGASAMPFVANLNASRNSFARLACPLVLWVPQYVLSAITLGAPDFFSVRSGVYFFTSTPGETSGIAESLMSGSIWSMDNITSSEKNERIAAIKSLLADYELLPDGERDKRIEMRLHTRIGALLNKIGQNGVALEHFQQALAVARDLSDRANEAWALGNIAITESVLGNYQKAIDGLEKTLEIAHEFDDLRQEADILYNLGEVYRRQRELVKAESMYQQALQIYRQLRDEESESGTLINLGSIYDMEGRASDAAKANEQSLAIAQRIGDRDSQARALYNLARMYVNEGRVKEAVAMIEQALRISQELGDQTLERHSADLLINLRGESEQVS